MENNDQVKVYVHTTDWLKNAGDDPSNIPCRIDKWNETPLPLPEKPMDWDAPHELHKIWPPMRPRVGQGSSQDTNKNAIGMSFKIHGEKNDGRAADVVIKTVRNAFFNDSDYGLFLREDDVLDLVDPDVRDEYRSASACYRVIRRVRDNDVKFNNGLRSNTRDNTLIEGDCEPEDFGPSVEICVPLNSTIETVEKTLNFLATKNVNFSIPTGIRFVQASNHYMSPAYQRDCAFIEIAGWLPDIEGGQGVKDWQRFRDIYSAAFDELCDHLRDEIPEVRFHLGKNNNYTSQTLRDSFPEFNTWVRNYHLFNATESLIVRMPKDGTSVKVGPTWI